MVQSASTLHTWSLLLKHFIQRSFLIWAIVFAVGILTIFTKGIITLTASIYIILTITFYWSPAIISLTLIVIEGKTILLSWSIVAFIQHLLNFVRKNNSKSL